MADEATENLATVYYRLDDGGAIARELDGWERQVFHPEKGWIPIDVDFAVDAREISADEALRETGTAEEEFGEFAPATEGEPDGS